jgi:hypothetical protein
VIENSQCIIYLDTLTAAPFNLVQDDSVYVKVISTNIYGSSELSHEGNGAQIWLRPDPPINFVNRPEITDNSQIGIMWQDGANDGSTPVLDYRIWYALEDEVYQVLEAGVMD